MLMPLLALTAVAVLLGLALRRVRDKALAVLGVVGFFLIAIPALLVSGDVVERIIAAIFAYQPYWEYVVPVAAFAAALLPPPRRRPRGRAVRREKAEYW
ncbi:MAG: hypothetical protein ABWJ97_07810 [Thermoproteus sp.]